MTLDDRPEHSAVFYDGQSNRKRLVALRLGAQLEIVEDGVAIASWPFGDIRRADGHKTLRLSAVSAAPLARLDIEDEATAAALRQRCGSLDRDSGERQTLRIIGWSLAAACSIVLMALYGIPLAADRLTPLVPAGVEKRLGDAVDKQVRAVMGDKLCTAPEGQRALLKLVGKLKEAGGASMELDPQVLTSFTPNAVALPGGRIYLFEPLLREARSPDEVAGVLAHEIGHAHHRDGLRTLLRTGGTSFLIGLLFGDITGGGAVIFAAQSILDASFSREAETAADEFAVRSMTGLGRSAAPLGTFLVRLTGSERRGTILDSHPVSAERLAHIEKLDRPTTGPALLSDAEWRALREICAKPGT